MVTHQLQVERGTGKFAGQRPTFYHSAVRQLNRPDDLIDELPVEKRHLSKLIICRI